MFRFKIKVINAFNNYILNIKLINNFSMNKIGPLGVENLCNYGLKKLP